MGRTILNSHTYWARTIVARTSVTNGPGEIESTYILNHDKRGENISIQALEKNGIHSPPEPGQRGREHQRLVACERSKSRTYWARTTVLRVSEPNFLGKMVFTHRLCQDKHGENISVQWDVRNWFHVHTKPEQPWQEDQNPIGCERLRSHTDWSRTDAARISASNRLREIGIAHRLSQDDRDEYVSVSWDIRNPNRLHAEPGQSWQECQRPMQYEESISHTVWTKTTIATMSMSDGTWGNQPHVHTEPAQSSRDCQRSIGCESQCHLLPEPEQPWRMSASVKGCEKLIPHTPWARTTAARMLAFNGLYETEITYILRQTSRGDNVSIKSTGIIWNYVHNESMQ